MKDQVTDTSQQDITLDPKFISKEIDRLLGWEILQRFCRNEENLPMRPLDLCDKIGVNKGYVHRVTEQIKNKLHAER